MPRWIETTYTKQTTLSNNTIKQHHPKPEHVIQSDAKHVESKLYYKIPEQNKISSTHKEKRVMTKKKKCINGNETH